MAASPAKRAKVMSRWNPSLEECTAFDPTSIGLPADFALLDYAKLKG